MKSNGQYNNGPLKEDMYQVWADYHVKFLDAYEKEGVTFWAISNGNEPFTGFVPFNKIPSVAWTSRNLVSNFTVLFRTIKFNSRGLSKNETADFLTGV